MQLIIILRDSRELTDDTEVEVQTSSGETLALPYGRAKELQDIGLDANDALVNAQETYNTATQEVYDLAQKAADELYERKRQAAEEAEAERQRQAAEEAEQAAE